MKIHKWLTLNSNVYNSLYKFWTNYCPNCGAKLSEWRGVHDICKKCDLQ